MDEAASMQMGPVTRKIRRAESALQQRVEFEALVSRISSQFVRLRSEDLDDGIADAEARIRAIIADILNEYEAVLTFRRKDSK